MVSKTSQPCRNYRATSTNVACYSVVTLLTHKLRYSVGYTQNKLFSLVAADIGNQGRVKTLTQQKTV